MNGPGRGQGPGGVWTRGGLQRRPPCPTRRQRPSPGHHGNDKRMRTIISTPVSFSCEASARNYSRLHPMGPIFLKKVSAHSGTRKNKRFVYSIQRYFYRGLLRRTHTSGCVRRRRCIATRNSGEATARRETHAAAREPEGGGA